VSEIQYKILVVEDDENIVYLIHHYFSKIDQRCYVISHESNLKGAEAFLEKEKVDVVLLDLFLPDSSDYKETVRHINSCFDGPIVVLTSLSDKNLAKNLISQGVEDYICKDSLNEEILIRTLRYSIERYRRNYQIKQAEKRCNYSGRFFG